MEASAARRGDAKLALVDVSAQEQASSRDSDVSNSKRYNVFLGLCLVGFFINCQPSEPFLTRFLIEDKGLTEDQLDNEVWPYNTYGSFFFLLPVGFVAEIYGLKLTPIHIIFHLEFCGIRDSVQRICMHPSVDVPHPSSVVCANS
eukprot:496876-Amorphochlora_amoeboformis.AAC.1